MLLIEIEPVAELEALVVVGLPVPYQAILTREWIIGEVDLWNRERGRNMFKRSRKVGGS